MATGLKNKSDIIDKRRQLRKNQTEAEMILWQQLRSKRLSGLKFYRQYSVGFYILDFYCPERRVAIELDGGQHAEPSNMEKDNQRTSYLEKQGIRVHRFWNNEVLNNIQGVMEVLEGILRS